MQHQMAVSIEYEALAYVYNTLFAHAPLMALISELHPSHHSGIANPVYPLVTYEILISRDDRLIQDPRVEIAIYSEKGSEEKWSIFGEIEEALLRKAGQTDNAYFINTTRVLATGADEYAQRKLYVVLAHYVLTGVKD